MTSTEEFNKANELYKSGKIAESSELFMDIIKRYKSIEGLCDYRLAACANIMGDPETAYGLYYAAFTEQPDLTQYLYAPDHPQHNYIFEGKKQEVETTACPLCGNEELKPKWCYSLTEATGYNSFFNPVRLWVYCEPCHHIIAKEFPEKLFLYNDKPRWPNTMFFSYYAAVLDRISKYTDGARLFEVGIGACECLLAAREIGFDTLGIDVIDKHVQMARDRFGLNAVTADFVGYDPGSEKYDIIIMGDVIEHVSDPVLAMTKARDMLSDNGAVWVSTPNFDSAHSIVSGHDDPMKRQLYHLNYFSRESFYLLLEKCGLIPADYNISSHYAGSMEVIAVRKERQG